MTGPNVSTGRTIARRHALDPARILSAVTVAGIFVQVFLAGLVVFGAGPGWDLHGLVGGLLALPILALATLAAMRPQARRYRRGAFLLSGLYILQVMLVVLAKDGGPAWLGALHPVNALALLLAAADLLRHGET